MQDAGCALTRRFAAQSLVYLLVRRVRRELQGHIAGHHHNRLLATACRIATSNVRGIWLAPEISSQ
jgi:hypothetical protein